MINLTKDIIIVKSGEDLERSIKDAITQAKECVCREVFDTNHIPISKITSGSRNEYYNASVVRIFDGHLNASNAPAYDEEWVRRLHICSKKTPALAIAKSVVPKTSHDWLNKSALERLSRDSLLILHFLWQSKVVLLPADVKKPVIGSTAANSKATSNTFEFAAATYTEVLALVSRPFVPHAFQEGVPDITTVMKLTAIKNFEWYAWRMIRCTDWHRIEDIDPNDIDALVMHLTLARRGEVDWFVYPMAPAAFWTYVQKLYPDRYQRRTTGHSTQPDAAAYGKNDALGDTGQFDEQTVIINIWNKYQTKFVELQKSRGMKTYDSYTKSFAVLNNFLFYDLPASTGKLPPLPNELTRNHIEGDGYVGLLGYLRKGRTNSTIQHLLYKIDALFNYLSAHSKSDHRLAGFANPICDIDFPVVKRNSGSNKPAFGSEHFPHLLQYSYAIESFASYLATKVHEEQIKLYSPEYQSDVETKDWNEAHKVVQTEKFGYVPIVFYRNPQFDISQPKSKSNQLMRYEALHLVSRSIVPIVDRAVENNGEWVFYPQLNYIRHNIVALETGIRSIHIRWLDKRSYGKNIDRSRSLPPLCKLHVNTDKVNGPWDATVCKSVIEVLDRQNSMLTWFDDASLDTEVWYDHHEDSPFGKIISIFSKGETPGVLHSGAYAKYFKRLIYSFDLFCRFQLGINSTNSMPEELSGIESIEDPNDFLAAVKLESHASKLIEHTPHSCRVSVVSEFIRILPPHIIGAHITGHATEAHVMYYAKVDPAYLRTVAEYQKMRIEHGWEFDRPAMSTIKAEDVASKLQQAFRRDKEKALVDFGAISFDRETKDDVVSGVKTARQRSLDSLAFMPTHICPVGNQCTADVVRDLGAVPGSVMPCGGCYLSIKTVDHLPRIHGHIRVLTDECSELESHIAEAKKNGASPESLVHRANHRKFLASEIISWSITAHCLEQMLNDIKARSSFLIEKPEIVSEHLERLELKDHTLTNLIARTSEAKSHAEYFTPQLKHQIMVARNKLLAFTGDFNRMLQEAPTGFTLIDEFRGLIRSTCEVLGLSLHDLSEAMGKPIALDRPDSILKLISSPGSVPA
ncbi:hypothetical protein [Pseudomonas sp. ICMP 561]|uniref:hypothetical protein n=1 Tax=Pseudomonas sp. ICMP 561 TaxID=1718918 RepID=UPI000C086C6C|nr:hypothetical protein [Pseudomonas sp. ICMP 561]PHN29757.1 hypothetical protein AO242_01700 [Pseudomonas sp. ICMP 561]